MKKVAVDVVLMVDREGGGGGDRWRCAEGEEEEKDGWPLMRKDEKVK